MTLVRSGAARPRVRRMPPRATKAAVTSLLVASGWLASCSSTTTQTAGLEVIAKTDRVTPGVDFDTVAVLVEQEEPGHLGGVRYRDSKPVDVPQARASRARRFRSRRRHAAPASALIVMRTF